MDDKNIRENKVKAGMPSFESESIHKQPTIKGVPGLLKTSRVFRFKEFFIKEMERMLSGRPEIPEITQKITRAKIVDVVFAFKNSELIKMLIKRGQLIVNGNKDKLEKLEAEIDEWMVNHQEEMTTPVRAFVTFATEESYLRAMNCTKSIVWGKVETEEHWMGQPIFFKPAPEPSNVLWEN